MTTILRGYQITFNRDLANAVRLLKRIIACMPTGGGKTKCFIAIAQSAINRNRTALIITESRKIFTQIQQEAGGIEINAKVGSHIYIQPNKIYIAMAQTLARRPFILDQFEKMGESLLIINDEAHVATANKVLRILNTALLIGFTATPVYENAKHLPEFYRGIVVGAQVSDLIQLDALKPYRHYARVGAEMDRLQIQRGEFTEESQMAAFENKAVYDGLLDDLRKFKYNKAMVFCSSISHCEDTFEMLEFNGIPAIRYHSQHEASAFDLSRYENEDINVCVSVASLNKGYDHPPTDLTALLFKTMSLTRYLQSIGRASRPAENKPYHICLDYGLNYMQHGLWDMDRPYETLWLPDPDITRRRKKDSLQIATVKSCPDCEAIIPSSTQVCPYCGAILRIEQPLVNGELIEVTELYSKLIDKKISELNPEELAIYAKLKNKRGFGIRVAKAQQQKKDGWLKEYGKAMGYAGNWYHIVEKQIDKEEIKFNDFTLK